MKITIYPSAWAEKITREVIGSIYIKIKMICSMTIDFVYFNCSFISESSHESIYINRC